MNKMIPELIVMLTHNDHTVADADRVFEACCHSKAHYFGFKEQGLEAAKMPVLFDRMRACGKKTVLEVVSYDEAECLAGAKTATACGVDLLMGTLFFESVNDWCQSHDLKYMPFVGEVTQRPSVLGGSLEEMIEQTRRYLEKGVYGVDLLGYRHPEGSVLIPKFVSAVDAPVCVAGSINSYERLDEIKAAAPWSFTIGGAFFEKKFGETMAEQIDRVCDYMAEGDR